MYSDFQLQLLPDTTGSFSWFKWLQTSAADVRSPAGDCLTMYLDVRMSHTKPPSDTGGDADWLFEELWLLLLCEQQPCIKKKRWWWWAAYSDPTSTCSANAVTRGWESTADTRNEPAQVDMRLCSRGRPWVCGNAVGMFLRLRASSTERVRSL